MPEHGEFDPQSQKWYCSYWMSQEEWEDIHDYAPPNSSGAAVFAEAEQEDEEDKGEREQDEEGEEG